MADYLGKLANDSEQYVKQCDDGSWCCEAHSPPLNDQNVLNSTMQNQVNACCSQGSGVFIEDGKVTNVNPDGSTISASATTAATQSPSLPTTTAVTQPPSSPTTSPIPQPIKHTGAIAGGVVGGIAGLFLIVVAIFYCRRTKRKPDSMPEDSFGQGIRGVYGLHEKDGTGKIQEKDGTERIQEKDGNEKFETDGKQVAGERNGPYEM